MIEDIFYVSFDITNHLSFFWIIVHIVLAFVRCSKKILRVLEFPRSLIRSSVIDRKKWLFKKQSMRTRNLSDLIKIHLMN